MISSYHSTSDGQLNWMMSEKIVSYWVDVHERTCSLLGHTWDDLESPSFLFLSWWCDCLLLSFVVIFCNQLISLSTRPLLDTALLPCRRPEPSEIKSRTPRSERKFFDLSSLWLVQSWLMITMATHNEIWLDVTIQSHLLWLELEWNQITCEHERCIWQTCNICEKCSAFFGLSCIPCVPVYCTPVGVSAISGDLGEKLWLFVPGPSFLEFYVHCKEIPENSKDSSLKTVELWEKTGKKARKIAKGRRSPQTARSGGVPGGGDSRRLFADFLGPYSSQQPSSELLKFLGLCNRPLTLILLQKYRDTNGRRIVIQIGGVYTTFCQEEGILLQKYCYRNGRCIAILFKSIGVRGRFDSLDERSISESPGHSSSDRARQMQRDAERRACEVAWSAHSVLERLWMWPVMAMSSTPPCSSVARFRLLPYVEISIYI